MNAPPLRREVGHIRVGRLVLNLSPQAMRSRTTRTLARDLRRALNWCRISTLDRPLSPAAPEVQKVRIRKLEVVLPADTDITQTQALAEAIIEATGTAAARAMHHPPRALAKALSEADAASPSASAPAAQGSGAPIGHAPTRSTDPQKSTPATGMTTHAELANQGLSLNQSDGPSDLWHTVSPPLGMLQSIAPGVTNLPLGPVSQASWFIRIAEGVSSASVPGPKTLENLPVTFQWSDRAILKTSTEAPDGPFVTRNAEMEQRRTPRMAYCSSDPRDIWSWASNLSPAVALSNARVEHLATAWTKPGAWYIHGQQETNAGAENTQGGPNLTASAWQQDRVGNGTAARRALAQSTAFVSLTAPQPRVWKAQIEGLPQALSAADQRAQDQSDKARGTSQRLENTIEKTPHPARQVPPPQAPAVYPQRLFPGADVPLPAPGAPSLSPGVITARIPLQPLPAASEHHTINSSRSTDAEVTTARPMAEGIKTQVGGLVFLHVFLRRFFAALDLIEAPKDSPPRFVTLEAGERAAALLWYTATAQRTFEPVETILPAHLAGLPKHLASRPALDPTPTEAAMIAQLLESALVGLVENTLPSVEALRRAVLVRPGRLMLDGALPRLLLTRHPIDRLLDDLGHLPARVQLPWMPEPLKLEYL